MPSVRSRLRQLKIRPPQSAVENARRGLQIRASLPKSRRGGLESNEAAKAGLRSGVALAHNLAEFPLGDPHAVLDEPEAYYLALCRFRGMAYRALEQGKTAETSKAIQVYLMRGGDPMLNLFKELLRKEL